MALISFTKKIHTQGPTQLILGNGLEITYALAQIVYTHNVECMQ